MPYCKQCHIHFETPQQKCVLCGQALDKDNKKTTIYFPSFKTPKAYHKIFKSFIYLNVLSFIVLFFIDIQNQIIDFSLIAGVIHLYAIIMASFVFLSEFWTLKVTKILLLTLILLLSIGLLIRESTWALDYVIPVVLAVNILLYAVVILFKKDREDDDGFTVLLLSLLGLLPYGFLLLGWIKEPLPTQVTFIISLSVILGLIFFNLRAIFEAIKRRFHV
ncbi:MAG: DUF6320 domain-containing protein [Firmicutes bacterium]|nr:DUF6320 domain-containing protein [Bacillota bacterium]